MSVNLIFDHHVETSKRVRDNTTMLNRALGQLTSECPLKSYAITFETPVCPTRPF